MNSVTNTGTRPQTAPDAGQAATVTAASYPYSPTHGHVKDPRLTNTVPNSTGVSAPPDEMGFIARPNPDGDEPQAQPQTESNSSSARRRSRTGSTVPQSNRFTVANMTDNEIPEDGPHTNTPGPTEIPSPAPAQQPKAWLTAEEEKARLYQEAKARVERVQGGLDRAGSVRVRLDSHNLSLDVPSNSSIGDTVDERISDSEQPAVVYPFSCPTSRYYAMGLCRRGKNPPFYTSSEQRSYHARLCARSKRCWSRRAWPRGFT